MTDDNVKKITGFISSAILATFILGLAHSISTGFAGFKGGLPFWVISIAVLAMVFYDYWDSAWRKSK